MYNINTNAFPFYMTYYSLYLFKVVMNYSLTVFLLQERENLVGILGIICGLVQATPQALLIFNCYYIVLGGVIDRDYLLI